MTIKEYLDSIGATTKYVVTPTKHHSKNGNPIYDFSIQADIPFEVNSKTTNVAHVTANFFKCIFAEGYNYGIFKLEEYLEEEFKGEIRDIALITIDCIDSIDIID